MAVWGALIRFQELHFDHFQIIRYNKAQNKAQKSQMTDREHILLLLKENSSLTQVELSEMMDKCKCQELFYIDFCGLFAILGGE